MGIPEGGYFPVLMHYAFITKELGLGNCSAFLSVAVMKHTDRKYSKRGKGLFDSFFQVTVHPRQPGMELKRALE